MSNIKFLDDVGIEKNSTLTMSSSVGSEYLTIDNNNTTSSAGCFLRLGNAAVDTSLVIERNNGESYVVFSNGQLTFYVDGEVPSMVQFFSSIPQTLVFGALTVGVATGQTTGSYIEVREAQTSGGNYVRLKAADSITASQDYTLPTNYPSSNGQVLSSTTAGVMSWSTGGTGDTNIANTNLSLDATRTLSLGGFSLDFNSNIGNVLDLNPSNVQIYNALYLRTDSTTTAPAMRFSEGTGNDFISLRAPDTLSGSTDFVLPAADGTAGQVLQTDGSGGLSFATAGGGGSNSSFSLISAGGRVTIGTASDNNARILVLGGSLGVNYFNWTTVMSNSTPSFTSLGTPGTSTTQGVPYNTNNAAFVSPKSGKISMTGTIEFSSASETAGAQMFLYIFKYPSSLVTAMANGTYVASTAMTLVGSTSVTAPSSAQNIIPMSFTCGGNITANSGEYFFGAFAYRGTVTGNRYFLINYNLFTE